LYNASIEGFKLDLLGVYKEPLSQSVLVAAVRGASNTEAPTIRTRLSERRVKFVTGANEQADLTVTRIHVQPRECGLRAHGRVCR
jgi:hypothetical protein